MAVTVKFLTGDEENLPISINNGSVYFAISDETKKQGKIYFDNNGVRYIMSSPSSEVAERVAHVLTIGEHKYDGSADVEVEIYGGETK